MHEISLLYVYSLYTVLLCLTGVCFSLRKRLKKLENERKRFSNIIKASLESSEKRLIFVPENHPDAELIFSINELLAVLHSERALDIKKEKNRKQIFANLSHDVRTPLASIIGYLEGIRLGYAKEEEREYIQIAEDKANELKHYLDSLFTLASIDAGEMSMVLEPVDLNESVRQCLLPFSALILSKNVKLLANISDAPLGVRLDSVAFSRLFNNLVQNALKFGLDGGVLGICTWCDEQYGYLEVWDRGKGIEAADLPFVFERLYRGADSSSTGGSGIGLHVVKELVARMNGIVTINSIPYERTGVRIALPLIPLPCKTL